MSQRHKEMMETDPPGGGRPTKAANEASPATLKPKPGFVGWDRSGGLSVGDVQDRGGSAKG